MMKNKNFIKNIFPKQQNKKHFLKFLFQKNQKTKVKLIGLLSFIKTAHFPNLKIEI